MEQPKRGETSFNLLLLGERFRILFNDLLKGKFGNEIKNDIKTFDQNIKEIEADPDCPQALKLLIELIITNSWYYKTPTYFETQFNHYISRYRVRGFQTADGMKELLNLAKLAPSRIRDKAIQKVNLLVDQLKGKTIRSWTENLYQLAKKNETTVLGEKGRDNFLRDFGYFDRIPMDRHEMRFIIRTGIYHACSLQNHFDPLEKRHLQVALVDFCRKFLSAEKIEGVDMGKAPGIVDLFIWCHCSKEKYDICGKKPKCGECILSGYCLFSILSGKHST